MDEYAFKRKPNFSQKELLVLIHEVKKKKHVLLGKFDKTASHSAKGKGWEQVADSMANISNCPRDSAELRKKFMDFRSLVKKKLVTRKKEMEHSANDSHPDFEPFSPAEKAMASLITNMDVKDLPSVFGEDSTTYVKPSRGPPRKKPLVDPAKKVVKKAKQQQIRAQYQPLRTRQLRTFRDRKNILEIYNDTELIKRFRLDRSGIMFLTNLVRDVLESPTVRSKAIEAEMKMFLTLHYLATGNMQLCNSEDFGPSQPSVSRMITQTLNILSSPDVVTRFIKFPQDPTEIQKKQGEFMQIAGFPGVVGVVDGSHIRVATPKEFEPEFVNTKNFHSVNAQFVFDADLRILDVVANWPGSTLDEQVLQNSGLLRMFEGNLIPPGCHLLGDNGYPCKQWLLTPYPRPQSYSQTAYNWAHHQTWSVISRGLNLLKRRFHILGTEVKVDPRKTCQVILACSALHNLCKDRNIPLPEETEVSEHAQVEENINPPLPENAAQDGICFRDQITHTHFNYEDRPWLGGFSTVMYS